MQPDPYPVSVLKRDYVGQELCSVARTLEIIGERWTWLIIRDAFLGVSRFREFQESLGVAPNVLNDRLDRLVDEGSSNEGLQRAPARYEYRLTQKGEDLFTALNALRQWGDQYLCAKPMRLLRVKGSETRSSQCLFPRERLLLPTTMDRARSGAGFRATSSAISRDIPAHSGTRRAVACHAEPTAAADRRVRTPLDTLVSVRRLTGNGRGAPRQRRASLELSPDEFRELGHALVDEVSSFLETLPQRRVAPGERAPEVRALLPVGGVPARGRDPGSF